MDYKLMISNLRKMGASDLHLEPGLVPTTRIQGDLKPLGKDPIDTGQTRAIAKDILNKAEWDGVEQKVGDTRSTGAKIISGILNLFRTGEHNWSEDETAPYGSVWALSLVVRIENAIGAQVYLGRGGLELLEKADFEGGIWFGDPMPEDYEILEVPDEELFQKRNRISRSVRIALYPLRTGG